MKTTSHNPTTSQNRPYHLIQQYPLICFGVLAYLLGWSVWPLYLTGYFFMPVLPVGTSVAALIVISVAQGRAGVVTFLRHSLLAWSLFSQWRWYLFALGLPALLLVAVMELSLLTGLPLNFERAVSHWSEPLLVPLYYLFSPFSGALGEEPAYCGFLMPYLIEQKQYRPTYATALMGLLWVGGHLPFFVTDSVTQPFLIAHILLLLTQAVIYSWLYQSTGWDVPIAIFFHATFNSLSCWLGPLFEGTDHRGLAVWWWGQVAISGVVALLLLTACWPLNNFSNYKPAIKPPNGRE